MCLTEKKIQIIFKNPIFEITKMEIGLIEYTLRLYISLTQTITIWGRIQNTESECQ